jgi:hypothetical protein
MIGQCSRECWITIWRLLQNIKTKYEWALYTKVVCITFHVLIWKIITMYSKPLVVVVVKPCSRWVAFDPQKNKIKKKKDHKL